jgi:flagellar motor component MotA
VVVVGVAVAVGVVVGVAVAVAVVVGAVVAVAVVVGAVVAVAVVVAVVVGAVGAALVGVMMRPHDSPRAAALMLAEAARARLLADAVTALARFYEHV